MIVQPVALSQVPAHAVVEQQTVTTILDRITRDITSLRRGLDSGFHDIERTHPELAEFLAAEIAELDSAAGQSLAYFLSVLVYLSFREAFGSRLASISSDDVKRLHEQLIADGTLRHSGISEGTYSEDHITIGQPALVRMVRREIDRASSEDGIPWSALDPLFEALLVEVLLLSEAVTLPQRQSRSSFAA
jgi:hypothetical protein